MLYRTGCSAHPFAFCTGADFFLKRSTHHLHYSDEWKRSRGSATGFVSTEIPTRKTLGDRGEAWDFRSPEPNGEAAPAIFGYF